MALAKASVSQGDGVFKLVRGQAVVAPLLNRAQEAVADHLWLSEPLGQDPVLDIANRHESLPLGRVPGGRVTATAIGNGLRPLGLGSSRWGRIGRRGVDSSHRLADRSRLGVGG